MKKESEGGTASNGYSEAKRMRRDVAGFIKKMKSRQQVEREVERCRNCNAKSIRYRSKMESWVCTGCGFTWSVFEEQEFQDIENALIDTDFQIRYHLPFSMKTIEHAIERLNAEEVKNE